MKSQILLSTRFVTLALILILALDTSVIRPSNVPAHASAPNSLQGAVRPALDSSINPDLQGRHATRAAGSPPQFGHALASPAFPAPFAPAIAGDEWWDGRFPLGEMIGSLPLP